MIFKQCLYPSLNDSLEGNPHIIEIDVRNNQLHEETEKDIDEIITKNFLASKNIPYKSLFEYEKEGDKPAGQQAKTEKKEEETKAGGAEGQAAKNAEEQSAVGGAPSQNPDDGAME